MTCSDTGTDAHHVLSHVHDHMRCAITGTCDRVLSGAAADSVARTMDEAPAPRCTGAGSAAASQGRSSQGGSWGTTASSQPLWDMTGGAAAGGPREVTVPGGVVVLGMDAAAVLGVDAEGAAATLATALAMLHCWGVDATADEAVRVGVLCIGVCV